MIHGLRTRTDVVLKSIWSPLSLFPSSFPPSGPNLHVLGICRNHKIARISFRVRSQRLQPGHAASAPPLRSSALPPFVLVVFPYFIPAFPRGIHGWNPPRVVVCSLLSHSTYDNNSSLPTKLAFVRHLRKFVLLLQVMRSYQNG